MRPNKTGIKIGIRLSAVLFSAFWMSEVTACAAAPKRGERLIALAEEFIEAEMLFRWDEGLTDAEKDFLRTVEKGEKFERDIVGALGQEQRNAFKEKWNKAEESHAEKEGKWKEARAEHEQKLKQWKENRKTNAASEPPTPPYVLRPIKPHKYQVLEEYISEYETAQWPAEATLRGELITWLGREREVRALISRPRIQIEGCRITDTIDWQSVDVHWSLECFHCDFENAPNLRHAELKGLFLSGSLVPGIDADGMNVKGDVFLRQGFHSYGEVRLLGATMGGNLECNGATMENENGNGDTLNVSAINVKGSVFLSGKFHSRGKVRLSGVTIGGILFCDGATMENEGGDALTADGMNVKGDVFLSENFYSRGEVRLLGVTIGGDLACNGATMENQGGAALTADGMNVKGDVFLSENFYSRGEVRLLGAIIGGDLACNGATMENQGAEALYADGMNVKGHVFLRENFHADGGINLIRARMGTFNWYELRNPADAILDLRHAKAGTISIGTKGADYPTEDLPEPGNLYLYGFTYDSIDDQMPDDADWWIDFIKRQPSEATDGESSFLPQPYKQAARALKQAGHTEQATQVLISMENRRRDTLGWPKKLGSYALEWLIGYGHKPERAIWAALIVIIVGFLVFRRGYGSERVVAAEDWAYEKTQNPGEKKPRVLVFNYPRFSALIYSIDVFIPLVNLKQAEYWIPRSGTLQMTWMRVQTSAGWIVMTLLAAGLTGLVGG